MTHTKRVTRTVLLLAVAAIILLAVASAASAATAYVKTPGGTTAKIQNSVFYIAVATGANGTGERYYYYFTLDELKTKYGVESRDFTFDNHGVATTVKARGFSIVKLIDSLIDTYDRPLGIDETWSIQYLEEDAFHATGGSYIDTVLAARDTVKPMLTYEIKEIFDPSTKYNTSDTAYKVAENLYPELPRAYRQTGAANSAVLKMMMGVAVSPDGNAYNADTAGQYKLTGTDSDDTEIVLDSKGNLGRTVLGAMAGMRLGVRAASVAGYTPDAATQVVDRVEPKTTSTQVVTFEYTPYRYLTAKNWTSNATIPYTQIEMANSAVKVTIPESLAYVQSLVGTGDAAEVETNSIAPDTGGDWAATFVVPTRKLFIDGRASDDPSYAYPYGYTDLNMYRFQGAFAYQLAGIGDAADVTNVVVTSTGGAKKLYTGAAATSLFIAYGDSHSKACPDNTDESKRFSWVYNNPKAINEYDGDVRVGSVARVDANAKLVKSLKIRTKFGAKSVTLRRGKSIKLVCTTSPTGTCEKLTWKSSNAKIASVTSSGKVVASKTKTGKVKITATSSFGKKATFIITVRR